ncbi:MAG TPA: GNAT family N-acetyltransferase [Actinobacteria bacterium]|nr:GNAT family N-acetyltransferase [Actinomycetota bacterium]
MKPDLDVSARRAGPDDLHIVLGLYRKLEAEMQDERSKWTIADGLEEPVEETLRQVLNDGSDRIYIGEVDGYPFGFVLGRSEALLPQADGRRVASIRMVFTEPEARGVGVGELMRDALMEDFLQDGYGLFDAHVLPGHRLAKNFFEAGGFSARSIVMHHDIDRKR